MLIFSRTTGCNYTLTTTLTGFTNIEQVLFSPTGNCLAVVDFGAASVFLYPVDSTCTATGSPTIIPSPSPFRAAFSADGSCLAVGNFPDDIVNIYPLVSDCVFSTTPSTTYTGVNASQLLFSHSGNCFIIGSSQSNVVSIYPQISGCTYSTTASTQITPVFQTILSIALSLNDSCLVITSLESALVRALDPQLSIYPLIGSCSYNTTPTTNITLPSTIAFAAFSSISNCLAVAIQNGVLIYNASSLTLAVNPTSTTVVVNDSLTITSTVTGGANPLTYSWVGPNGFTATTPDITIPSVTPADAGTYTLTVTDSLGCQAVASSVVTVNPCTSPLVVNVTPAVTQVRVGGTAQLTANASGATPPYTYFWTGPDGFTAVTQTITIPNITAAQGGTYMVTVTDNFGCQNSATGQIIVVPCDTLIVSIIPSTESVTVGSTLTFSSSVSGGTPPYVSFAWTGPDGFSATAPTITIPNFTPANAGTYTLTVTDSLGCQTTATAVATLNPCTTPLIVNVNPPVTAVKSGATVQLTTIASGATPPYSFAWRGPSGFTATSQTISLPSVTTAQGGTYTVTVTDSLGCQTSATAQVIVDPCNTLVVTITPSTATVTAGSSLTIT